MELRRSLWDPRIAVPSLILLALGFLLFYFWGAEASSPASTLILLALFILYRGLRIRYVLNESSLKVYRGATSRRSFPSRSSEMRR
jgi:uncharacterized membrane protein